MIFMFLLALSIPSLAEAACSGAGLAWTCPAGSTVADVNTALASATDGATVTFDAGAYSWATSINLSDAKGITLVCASAGECVVAVGGSFIVNMPTDSANNSKLYRVSGFAWQNAPSGSYTIGFYGNSDNVKMSNIRVDHNTVSGYPTDATFLLLGDNARVNVFYGLFDHNTITGAVSYRAVYSLGTVWTSQPETAYPGLSNNFFMEDNVFNFTALSGATICIDGWGGDAIVFRFNDVTNCLITNHGVNAGGGPWNFEFYGNHITITDAGVSAPTFEDCYRCFHHLGSGSMYAFSNALTPKVGHAASPISFTHYRSIPVGVSGLTDPPGQCDGTRTTTGSVFAGAAPDGNRTPTATHRGYPCFRQPGRDGNGVLLPVYGWNNTFTDTGAMAPLVFEDICGGNTPCYSSNHIQANRDYYAAVSKDAQTTSSSPFSGATGMGFGTLSNRPTTCTPTGDAADAGNGGVAYWATDQGTWNQSGSNPYGVQQNGADGVLYRCSATNTWTVHYTPYTYPHPLQGGGVRHKVSGGAKISGGVVMQ
jgi:hypothetical protein